MSDTSERLAMQQRMDALLARACRDSESAAYALGVLQELSRLSPTPPGEMDYESRFALSMDLIESWVEKK